MNCRAEAPEIEQFAREHADLVNVIGIGTQDSQQLAVDFVEQTDTNSFPMLWDPTGQSWTQLRLFSQPAWMLVAPDGKLSIGARGGIDKDAIVEVASAFAGNG